MARRSAREPEPAKAATAEPVRLAAADRRDALLDAAAELVAAGDVEAVSMEAVAERAGVTEAVDLAVGAEHPVPTAGRGPVHDDRSGRRARAGRPRPGSAGARPG